MRLPLHYLAVLILAASLFASAEVLTGKVKNRATNQPAAGGEIGLLSLGQGLEESGLTKTDAHGKFSFKLSHCGTPHVIRAIHLGVAYHRSGQPVRPAQLTIPAVKHEGEFVAYPVHHVRDQV